MNFAFSALSLNKVSDEYKDCSNCKSAWKLMAKLAYAFAIHAEAVWDDDNDENDNAHINVGYHRLTLYRSNKGYGLYLSYGNHPLMVEIGQWVEMGNPMLFDLMATRVANCMPHRMLAEVVTFVLDAVCLDLHLDEDNGGDHLRVDRIWVDDDMRKLTCLMGDVEATFDVDYLDNLSTMEDGWNEFVKDLHEAYDKQSEA